MDITAIIQNTLMWLMTYGYWVIPVIALLVFAGGKKRSRHAFNVHISKKHLKRLRAIDNTRQQFGFLRAVDPFIFEEMVLTALDKLGYRIKRNSRYTGDGGIDGRVKIDGRWVLIQAKRYRAHINQQHVRAFAEICEKQKVSGIFIHTGKTSKATRLIKGAHIDIVSGDRMLEMLTACEYLPNYIQ